MDTTKGSDEIRRKICKELTVLLRTKIVIQNKHKKTRFCTVYDLSFPLRPKIHQDTRLELLGRATHSSNLAEQGFQWMISGNHSAMQGTLCGWLELKIN